MLLPKISIRCQKKTERDNEMYLKQKKIDFDDFKWVPGLLAKWYFLGKRPVKGRVHQF